VITSWKVRGQFDPAARWIARRRQVGRSRNARRDTAEQIIKGPGLDTHTVPGEHDVLDDEGKTFFERFTKATPRNYRSTSIPLDAME
jgi:hypothetical protein